MILVLYDAALEPPGVPPAPLDESTPEQLAEVTDTYGALPVDSEAGEL